MSKQKYRPLIIILGIPFMVGMAIVLWDRNKSNQISEELLAAEEIYEEEVIVVEEAPVPEERYTAEEKLAIYQLFSEIETLSRELITTELRLFCYYITLKNKDFLDILTENDVSAIIGELKQFQPEDIDKLLYHQEEMLIYANTIEAFSQGKWTDEYGHLGYVHMSYYGIEPGVFLKVDFSPTIDEILLQTITDHPNIDIIYNSYLVDEPLFIHLADTKNNNIIPLIQFFLDNGVDINTRSPNSNKTIFSSVGTLEIAQLLLANGADHTIIANDGETPLIQAVTRERSNELIKFLIDSGVDLHAKAPYFVGDVDLTALEMVEKSIEWLRAINDPDYNPKYGPTIDRIYKAEEVVRIIEQALEAEKKS